MRNSLPIHIREALRFYVFPCGNDGNYNKLYSKHRFNKEDWEAQFGPTVDNIECDFFGYVQEVICTLPVLEAKKIANTFSVTTSRDITHQLGNGDDQSSEIDSISAPPFDAACGGGCDSCSASPMSPRYRRNDSNAQYQVDAVQQYVAAEVTAGGWKSLKSKIQQLERDCGVALLLMRNKPVLRAIACVVVIAPTDSAARLFNFVDSNRPSHPAVEELMDAGRLVYIQNPEIQSYVLKKVEVGVAEVSGSVAELHAGMEATQESVESLRADFDNLKSDVNNMKASMEQIDSKLGLLLSVLAVQQQPPQPPPPPQQQQQES